MVLGKWRDTDTNLDLLGDRLLEEPGVGNWESGVGGKRAEGAGEAGEAIQNSLHPTPHTLFTSH
ncbi:hypothetical protein [Scytonema millei]|uniref:Uncharacterized protein n=1 Tax=Scytonema millei VB511283 TaxID=1245923 RepID=A0A9X5I2L8_9CYAN|nr:hypothetical protein [Scytonema millei]NHC33136.1 hypothetical protein [Scytonema millei VB511283]